MRPTKLSISAFGPYAGYVEIPMDMLGNEGLYLITGDTGAGKTTIFDAICFALFGEPSGPTRDKTMFRSKYADPQTPTEVGLCFIHGKKQYRVKRNPEYMRPAKRGGKMTREPAEAELYLPDGSVITKTRTVTEAIENILGVNRDQFSQIAMLAQGDFLKLLLADTRTRIEIFRELFKTDNYLALQKKLDTSEKELLAGIKDERKSVDQYISGIAVDEDDVLSVEVKKAVAGELTTEDVIGLLDRLTDQDSALRDRLDGEFDSINGELEKVNAALGAAGALENAKAALKKAEERLTKEEPRIKELEKALEQAENDLSQKPGLEKRAALLEGSLGDYDRLGQLELKAAAALENIKRSGAELEKSKKTKEALTAETNSLKDEYSGLEDVSALLEKSRAGIEKLNTEKEETMRLTDALKSFFGDREKLERLKDDYVQKDDLFRQLNHAYETMDQAFMDGQAGILAGKLKDGERCPVCGSLSHPEPASLAENVPTQAELKEAKLAAEKARSEREKASSLAGGHDKALSLKEEELKAMTLKMIKTDDLQTALGISEEKTNKLVDQIRQEAATVSELEAGLKRKEELSGLIREKEHKLDNLSNVIGELSIKITGDEAAQKETALRIGEIKKELEYENRDLAVEQINNARKHAKMLQKAYDKTREDLNAQSSIVEGLKREIESLEKTISETKADDTDRMKERQIALNEKLRECRDKRDTVSGKIRSNEDIRSRIIKKAEGIGSIEKKLQWIGALSKTANGQLAGKEKIMLETYIQTTYFDRIIRRANLRLLTMSSGQYELIRLKEAGNVKSQSGLELGVTDHYNGTQRSVRTLSGGESFMASLSLALGLSDEVQSSAGGIQIDTMFVDEGFGSLDPGALDQAYKALCSLAEGNRLVGIISHVADLKARVDKQIVVTKSMSKGSDVKLIV